MTCAKSVTRKMPVRRSVVLSRLAAADCATTHGAWPRSDRRPRAGPRNDAHSVSNVDVERECGRFDGQTGCGLTRAAAARIGTNGVETRCADEFARFLSSGSVTTSSMPAGGSGSSGGGFASWSALMMGSNGAASNNAADNGNATTGLHLSLAICSRVSRVKCCRCARALVDRRRRQCDIVLLSGARVSFGSFFHLAAGLTAMTILSCSVDLRAGRPARRHSRSGERSDRSRRGAPLSQCVSPLLANTRSNSCAR